VNRFVDLLLESMVKRDVGVLPLAPHYASTEDSRPSAVQLMTCWRTITGVNCVSQVVEDEQRGNVFFTASLDESGTASIAFGRVKVVDELITEIELYVDRSRCDSGFVYLPDQMDKLPEIWTRPVPADGAATRAELDALGAAIYDTAGAVEYATAEGCVLLEIGGVVYEDAKYLAALTGQPAAPDAHPTPIGGGLWPGRPIDPDHGEVIAVDEHQGVVVSRLSVDGFVCPYVVDNENSSCFVPAMMLADHMRTLDIADVDGKNILEQMRATATTFEMVRFFDNKVQGMHRYIQMQASGGRTPWVRR
jgi:hypothetical protein